VMRPKRPGDQQQTGNEQERFCEVVSHDQDSTPHRFRCQSYLGPLYRGVARLLRFRYNRIPMENLSPSPLPEPLAVEDAGENAK
jgi:hypothetical protein